MLAWLYWNPPKEIFTVPWIDRPIVWYGALFVAGFILGYFIFVPILTRYLRESKHLAAIDVINWKQLILILKKANQDSPPLILQLLQKLDPSTQSKLKEIDPDSELSHPLKEAVLNALNDLLHDKGVQRSDIENALPAIAHAKRTAFFLADRLVWFAVLGTVIGARLGQVFFYDWDLFYQHPIEIFKVWKGGLASHGGVVGVVFAVYLYTLSIRKWEPELTFLKLLDFIAIPSALVACFIRLGNFMNQEIVGTPSNLPWAVVFGNAADGSLPIPRHAIQLYEAFAYLATFVILYRLWKVKAEQLRTGFLIGLMLILIFGSRFFLEFWKVQQISSFDTPYLQMGQLLSIPFVLVGLFLVFLSKYEKKQLSLLLF